MLMNTSSIIPALAKICSTKVFFNLNFAIIYTYPPIDLNPDTAKY